MKRSASLALFVLFATGSLLGQQPHTRRPGPYLIYGPVHTFRDEHATITERNGQLVEGPRVLVQTFTYNEDGTKQERVSYLPDGSIEHKIVDRYEPDGRLIESANFDGSDHLLTRTVNTYDNQKELIEQVDYRADGSIMNRTTFRRRGNERQTETVVYDEHGAVIGQTSSTSITHIGRSDSQTIGRFNNRGMSIQGSVVENPDGSQEFTHSRSDGTFYREVNIPLEQHGNERVKYKPDGTILSHERFTREFDSYGNLIKTTRSAAKGDSPNFVPVDVTYRTLTYYGQN